MNEESDQPPTDLLAGTDEMIPEKSGSTEAKKRGTTRKKREHGDPAKRRASRRKDANAVAVAIKYAALVLLVAQMVGLVLLMRYSRTSQDPGQPLYLASTAVFFMEVMKLVICCGVIAYQSGGDLLGELNKHVVNAPVEMLKLSVPSFLYTVQNNLLYFALTNLDAATYQVCYQLKILTTAVFSMVMLEVWNAMMNFPHMSCTYSPSALPFRVAQILGSEVGCFDHVDHWCFDRTNIGYSGLDGFGCRKASSIRWSRGRPLCGVYLGIFWRLL